MGGRESFAFAGGFAAVELFLDANEFWSREMEARIRRG